MQHTSEHFDEYVPRDLDDNLSYRDCLLTHCAKDPVLRAVVLDRCREDPLFFIGTFGWLHEPRSPEPWKMGNPFEGVKVIPFIPRDLQANLNDRILPSLGIRDIICPKSRETGITWFFEALAVWDWRFHQSDIGMLSKDEDSVQSAGGTGSLFAKFQFLLDRLPKWMKCVQGVDYVRNISDVTFRRLDSVATVKGEASGPDPFRGERYKWVLNDEMHFFPKESDFQARDSLVGVTPCRVMVSTINRERGAAGAFWESWQDTEADSCVVEVDWREDPAKRRGLYKTNIAGQLQIIDKKFWSKYRLPDRNRATRYQDPTNPDIEYNFIRDERERSLYYDAFCRRPGVNRQTAAAELDRDVSGATAQLCDARVIADAIKKCESPVQTGLLTPTDDPTEWVFNWSLPSPQMKLWLQLAKDGTPPVAEYSMGVDVAAGTGGDWSSYSGISVFDRKTGEQVFEWRSNTTNPLDLAGIAYCVGRWFHYAHMVPEVNGTTGAMFINQLVDYGYTDIHMRRKDRKAWKEQGMAPGYWNNDGGASILTRLESAIKSGAARVQSELALKEMGQYFYRNGKLVQAAAQSSEDEGGRGQAHGDMAIALATAWLGVVDLPRPKDEPATQHIPPNCFAARQQRARDAARESKDVSYWSPW